MRSLLKCLGTVSVAFSLVGCGPSEAEKAQAQQAQAIVEAKSAAAEELRDPSSAQFRAERLSKLGAFCAEINAKNGFGAYVGFERIIVTNKGVVYNEDGRSSISSLAAKRVDKEQLDSLRTLQKADELILRYDKLGSNSNQEYEQKVKERFDGEWAEHCPEVS